MAATRRKDTFTTGDLARLCGVAPRTVVKWCETGRLAFYRIPGSQDRRITLDAFRAFVESHGLPASWLEEARDGR